MSPAQLLAIAAQSAASLVELIAMCQKLGRGVEPTESEINDAKGRAELAYHEFQKLTRKSEGSDDSA